MDQLLKEQREVMRQIHRTLENFRKIGQANYTTCNIRCRQALLQERWRKCQALHSAIVAAASQDDVERLSYFRSDEMQTTEDSYFEAADFFAELLDKLSTPVSNSSIVNNSTALNAASMPLPRIQLPKFSGQYTEWSNFRDLFHSLVVSNEGLSDVQRLHYLKMSLIGEASLILRNISVTEANYQTAWTELTRRYENKRMIVSSHLRAVLELTPMKSESATELKRVYDNINDSVHALKNLGRAVDDDFVVAIIERKLDVKTLQEWNLLLGGATELPTFKELSQFLVNRLRALEATQQISEGNKKSSRTTNTKSLVSAVDKSKCISCNEAHSLYQCTKFKSLNVGKRKELVKKHRCCFNCLGKGHYPRNCLSSRKCARCGRKHHSLLHEEVEGNNSDKEKAESDKEDEGSAANSVSPTTSSVALKALISRDSFDDSPTRVLLATARVTVRSFAGRSVKLRALIDTGSEATFISERAAQSLRLSRRKVKIRVTGIGDQCANVVNYTSQIQIGACGNDDDFIKTSALILPNLTSHRDIPNFRFDTIPHLRGIKLADGNKSKLDRIDLLIGADLYGSILLDGLRKGSADEPIAQRTIFGWIVFGPCAPSTRRGTPSKGISCLQSNIPHANELNLRKFWELEEIPSFHALSEDENRCELHFASTHSRRTDGRYVVKLPFKEGAVTEFVDSFQIASRSLNRLEIRLSKDVKLAEAYSSFLSEYEQLGHMAPTVLPKNSDFRTSAGYYMPHHPVLRESSTTSPLRVVFNASCVTRSGSSLNDQLLTGPKLQTDLPSILLRWRTHRLVYIADIAKMFRQIFVYPADTKYQRILWRSDVDKPVSSYDLLTVTYGTACAPYLAMRVLKQLCDDEGAAFPRATSVLHESTYVDDVLFGAHDPSEISEIREQLNSLLKLGGFHLRKWTSNSAELLHEIPKTDLLVSTPVSFSDNQPIKALGLSWKPERDCFTFHFNSPEFEKTRGNIETTKRSVLSIISRIFDPLGLITPIVILAKVFLQELWIRKLDWDSPLPSDLRESWESYFENLKCLHEVSIPRWTNQSPNINGVQLHGFADASSRAYAAVVYLRVEIDANLVRTSLLISKTKIAPLQTVSIPRLELCAAQLLTKLLSFVKLTLNLSTVPLYCWSDSMITLSWIKKHPSQWKTFVANRVADIQNRLPDAVWGYVNTKQNPADCASRGVSTSYLKDHHLWWYGPSWLKLDTSSWPEQPHPEGILIEEEMRSVKTLIVRSDRSEWNLPDDVSTWPRLLKITAYCILLCSKLSRYRRFSTLAQNDCKNSLAIAIKLARSFWIRSVQIFHFSDEISAIKSGAQLPKASKLKSLNPFVDDDGLLRVGGRLENSPFSYEEKHPVILPRHRISDLIVEQAHRRCLHGGSQLTLRAVRQQFWILNARNLVKSVVHNCVICTRYRAKPISQQMGELPKARVTPSRPFVHTGVDYAGPFHATCSATRGQKSHKVYVALFVCLSTRAIHLELVNDYTSNGFIAAFKRFSARRGLPSVMYSDNGTNFQGAERELSRAFYALTRDSNLKSWLATDKISWKFIPPSAPHFGGLWEAGVKAMKHHFKRIVGSHTLSLEEFSTLLAQIESCLNSRPISPLTDDPNDLSSLTPGHFLVGRPLNSMPEESVLDLSEARLSRRQRVHRMFESFWRIWSKDYLHGLQQRNKWQQGCDNLRVGELVIVRNDLLPPSKWELARIVKVFPDSSGNVRVAEVKTASGLFKRPIVKLCKLPVETCQN
ncbi:uncharacterized protein LOC114882376 [Osmia bicornis bicornis]|uniref:uncharacterized protein LOC114882376 n=1 Tax=Osmia bicornis bicornis TaxID=1437191 RepID=UPI001EAF4936|nr:uncharacterized protein LOC114882376 [Osmia bicornis bicornis]